jgi:hypothetical protein
MFDVRNCTFALRSSELDGIDFDEASCSSDEEEYSPSEDNYQILLTRSVIAQVGGRDVPFPNRRERGNCFQISSKYFCERY